MCFYDLSTLCGLFKDKIYFGFTEQQKKNNFLFATRMRDLTSSLRQDVTQGLLLCEEPIRIHMGQGQRLPSPHDYFYAGIDITTTPTCLSALRKVLLKVWNSHYQTPSRIPNEEQRDTTL